MKAKFTVFIALATMGIVFSSCKRYYDCQCINYRGEVTKSVVKADNKTQARKDCNASGLAGSCELK